MTKLSNHLRGSKKYQLQEVLLHKLADAPSSPVSGQVYYNTTSNNTFVYNGTQWVQINNVNMTDNDILDAVKRVDGTGSGLDADLLDNQEGSYYTNRSNHTGTQTASTISDFDTQVRTNRLDQLAVPTASVSLNSQKITSLADPTSAQDAATKAYVDAVAQGLDPKASVKVVATTPITAQSPQTINGVSVVPGDRVLLTAQSTATENRIYIVEGGNWTVATDSNDTNLTKGAYTFSEANGKGYVYLGSNQWTQFTEATAINAGTGITVTTSGTTSTISLNHDLDGGTTYVPKAASFLIGNGTDLSFPLISFGGDNKVVSVRENGSGGAYVLADIVHTSAVQTTVTFAEAPTTNQYRVTIVGF